MKNTILKILLGLSFQLALVSAARAQYATALTVTDIQNKNVSKKIDLGVSALLTECNKAFVENRTPALGKISGLSADGKSAVLAMWEASPFRCIETEIIERGINGATGYQVRNIPISLKSLPEDDVRDIVIHFDRSGSIHDIHFALEQHEIKKVLGEGNDVTDLRRRQAILNFVENFRTAYNRKDIDLLAKVYSDDALIITGTVVRKLTDKGGDIPTSLKNIGFSQDVIKYQIFTKEEYINKLRKVFKENLRINIVFDDIEVTQHPKFEDIYGVLLKQNWNTTNYSDIGYLFLMIDFKDGENMQIHVRTWQPDKLNDQPLSDDEIFGLSDFVID